MFAGIEANLARQCAKYGGRMRMEDDDYHHAPGPHGFEKEEDGYLIEVSEYDHIRETLKLVRAGEVSTGSGHS